MLAEHYRTELGAVDCMTQRVDLFGQARHLRIPLALPSYRPSASHPEHLPLNPDPNPYAGPDPNPNPDPDPHLEPFRQASRESTLTPTPHP